MRLFFLTYVIFSSLQALADLERWQKWELERNDLQLNPAIYHALPSAAELKSYQVETLYYIKVSPHEVGLIQHGQEAPPTESIDFFIHPKALSLFSNLMKGKTLHKIAAIPTSSPRTFFVKDKLIKVSLPQKINGAIRTVYPLQMQRATIINDLLQNSGVLYLEEKIGVFDKSPNSPFGFLIREIPTDFQRGANTLVPLMSFVAQHPDGSLLEKNAHRAHESVDSFSQKHLVPALVQAFFKAASVGIAVEAHQQNTLLEVDPLGQMTGRIFFRDLDGCRVDFDLRQRMGFDDSKIFATKDFDWVFDQQQTKQLNREYTQHTSRESNARPPYWSGVIEKAWKTYLLGSSLHLIQSKTRGRDLREVATKILVQTRLAPSCRRVHLSH